MVVISTLSKYHCHQNHLGSGTIHVHVVLTTLLTYCQRREFIAISGTVFGLSLHYNTLILGSMFEPIEQ